MYAQYMPRPFPCLSIAYVLGMIVACIVGVGPINHSEPKTMKRQYPSFGSVSHATMRAEDLIPAFARELKHNVGPISAAHKDLVRKAEALTDYDSENADYILSALFDVLNVYAPPYAYFGAHPGDGADYGFWLSESVDQDVVDNGGIKIADLSDLPRGYTGEALLVNDHGNCTLYQCSRGRAREVWSIV